MKIRLLCKKVMLQNIVLRIDLLLIEMRGILQLRGEVRSSFATLKVVPLNKVSTSLCEAFKLDKLMADYMIHLF
ncbi:hypothetical protein [Epilithonimonas hominis]|uniref:Uncharacterized protein n=1 Tax=Epilithonimonas hominis TaxID=420404 RepID=A0A3N0XC64_9FLAO|nr:hypothetical protein [Epilithonimonas hominis]ROI14956.1 hypothetical protein EGH73_00740 [Epilithonimonas hominis]HAP95594.1 hypothetical protein [Chryseobacterium sp.]